MATISIERRLAAILCADVVGYSRLMGEDEAATLDALRACRALIDELIAEHHGRLFGSAGDSVLAEFPSAVEAVRCAIEIQDRTEREQAAVSEERRMRLRIGIDLGDVMVEGADLQGDGVNIAARLEALAEPGSIYLSGTAFDHVEGKLDYPVEFLGEKKVKDIARPIRVYRLEAGDLSTAAPAAWLPRLPWRWAALLTVAIAFLAGDALFWHAWLGWPTVEEVAFEPQEILPLPDEPSIAVLPFANLSGDAAQEYFSDGMTENLITNLSKLSGLFVIARNSTFTYKGRPVNVPEVGRELGVRYVLEGSVQRAADRVRISAQLIDAASGFHLWAEQFDRELEDIFALQDEVARQIIEALEIEVGESERKTLASRYTDSLEAYDSYLRGLQALWRGTARDHVEARRLFEAAIELDPGFALAHASLAMTYTGQSIDAPQAPEEALARALELARTALALDPTLPPVHLALSFALLYGEAFDEAIAAAERTIALEPNNADGHGVLALALMAAGEPEEALDAIDRAIRLNPRPPGAYLIVAAQCYFNLDRYDEGVTTLEHILDRNPNYARARMLLAASYAQVGRLEDAEWQVAELLTGDPQLTLENVRWAFARRNPEDLERLLDGLRRAGLPDEHDTDGS